MKLSPETIRKYLTWPEKNDERQYNITEGVSLKRNLTILVKGFKQCLAIHYCGVFGGTHEFFNCDSLIAVQIVGIKFAWKWNALSKNKNLHLAQWYTCTHLKSSSIFSQRFSYNKKIIHLTSMISPIPYGNL